MADTDEDLVGQTGPVAAEGKDNERPVNAEEDPQADDDLEHWVTGARPSRLSAEFGEAFATLEQAMGMPLWIYMHDGHLNDQARSTFFQCRRQITLAPQSALLIDSPGGDARSAYQIARIFQKSCVGGVVAVVPRYAKSAATLLTFGASEIFMGEYAELGPLDAQIMDPDREEFGSALDEVQALEHLQREVMRAIDEMMQVLLLRTGKKVESILPLVLEYHADFMRPLLDKIDTVHYTQRARVLEVGADYAQRLLEPTVGYERAKSISLQFVHNYAEHGFVVDREECEASGLPMYSASEMEKDALERIADLLDRPTRPMVVGRYTSSSATQEDDGAEVE